MFGLFKPRLQVKPGDVIEQRYNQELTLRWAVLSIQEMTDTWRDRVWFYGKQGFYVHCVSVNEILEPFSIDFVCDENGCLDTDIEQNLTKSSIPMNEREKDIFRKAVLE